MKDAIGFAALVAAFIAVWFVTPAAAELALIYDGEGNHVGTVLPAGRNTFIYDGSGELVGSTAPAGNSTFIYGADGSYEGMIMRNPATPGGRGALGLGR